MGNMFSSSIQRHYQSLSSTSNTQIVKSVEKDVDQEDIEEGPDFQNQRDSHSIHTNLYQVYQILNQSKPNVAFLKNAFIGFFALYMLRELDNLYKQDANKSRLIEDLYKKDENNSKRIEYQSMQIAALNEKIAVFINKNLDINDGKPFLAGLEDKKILHTIHNQPTQGIIEVSSNITLDRMSAFAQLIILKKPNLHLILPAANTVSPGLSFKFFGTFTGPTSKDKRCSIKVMDGSRDTILMGNNHEENYILVNSGEYLELVANEKSNCWYAANRNAALDITPVFEGVEGAEGARVEQGGWRRYTNTGMIEQWGSVDIPRPAIPIILEVKFPVPFTLKDSITIHGTFIGAGGAYVYELEGTRSETGVKLQLVTINASWQYAKTIRWSAKGY